jgi:hypothetical protein
MKKWKDFVNMRRVMTEKELLTLIVIQTFSKEQLMTHTLETETYCEVDGGRGVKLLLKYFFLGDIIPNYPFPKSKPTLVIRKISSPFRPSPIFRIVISSSHYHHDCFIYVCSDSGCCKPLFTKICVGEGGGGVNKNF